MATAKITLIGMYQWMELNEKHLFQNLTTPTGLDKDKLVNSILMKGAEFEVLYADADFMQQMIGVWSDKWQHVMERWVKLTSVDYDPLENYDRHEDWTDSKIEHAVAADTAGQEGGGTTTNKRAAYDSSNFENHDQSDSGSSGYSSGVTNTVAAGNSKHGGRTHGNIGVMSSQNMYLQELEVLKINMYDAISDLFLSEMVVYTY